jgi:hypothetical protein
MAKYLTKPCVDIDLKNIQISRKPTGEDGMYQTYYIFIGERLDYDGKILESFHEKWMVGTPGPDKWNSDTAEADVETVAAATKALFEDIYEESTITP